MKTIINIIFLKFCLNNMKDIFNGFIENITKHENTLIQYNSSQGIFEIENILKNAELDCLNITKSFITTTEIISKAIDVQHNIAYHKIYKGMSVDLDIDVINMINSQKLLLEKILKYHYELAYNYNNSNPIRRLNLIDDVKDGFQHLAKAILGEDIYNFLENIVKYIDDFLNTTILNFTEIKKTLESYSYNFSENCLYLNDTVVNITDVFHEMSFSAFNTAKKIFVTIAVVICLIILAGIINFIYKMKIIFTSEKKNENKLIQLKNLNNNNNNNF